jgi:putative hydrolase of the HAD superfamily
LQSCWQAHKFCGSNDPVGERKIMKKTTAIIALFADIGGVLLTNGWDHQARKRAAKMFGLDLNEMDDRHHLTFDIYEEGKLTLDEYLSRVVFYQRRSFTRAQFRKFMFAQSKPFPEMIELVRQLKSKYGLKIAVVSNEGRELNTHRIQTFKLNGFVDFFISSCFVHLRKPDEDIFRMALDIAQVPARRVVYIDDRAMFVQVAKSFGIHGIHHTDYKSTRAKLSVLRLEISELEMEQPEPCETAVKNDLQSALLC